MNVWGRGNAINLFLLVSLSTAFARLAHVMYGETWQRGHAHMHALHVWPLLAALFPGLEPPGCRSGHKSTCLVGYVVMLSTVRDEGAHQCICSAACLHNFRSK